MKKDELIEVYKNNDFNNPRNKTNFEEMEELKKLLDAGYITPDEYETKRKFILDLK